MLRIIQKRNWLFILSGLILIPGLVYLGLYGLKLGIDFTGGTSMTVTFATARPDGPAVAAKISALGFGQATAQTAGEKDIIIRLPAVNNDQRQTIIDSLTKSYTGLKEKAFDSIGPTIGAEMFRRALSAIALVLIAIIAYMSWAFRKVNVGPVPPWAYGLSAVIALVHDILIVIGIFAILGHFFNIEIDALFVTALLTVLGFSVHDTIVVFDRIRERLLQSHDESYEDTVNVSLNQTMVRSLATSFTTLLVLASLYLFGGLTIRNFILALLIGIASGTYSSIFVASPLLVVYNNWRQKRQR
jgi:preprotein translocase subunit SecF